MQEKRGSIRIEKSLMIRYSPEINSKGGWDITFIRNISEAGVLFDTNKQFQIGENVLVMLKIPLDPDNWLEAKGSVVESIPYMGKSFLTRLKFNYINDAQSNLIKDYVSWFLNTKGKAKQVFSHDEKRKAERINKTLIVSYGKQGPRGIVEKWDITTVRNISSTGMVFTSSHVCEGKIDFMIKIPSRPFEDLSIRGKVIESSALKLTNSDVASKTFLTRVEFINLENGHNKLLSDYVEWLIKNDPDKPKKEGA